jgi:hypothetical protein
MAKKHKNFLSGNMIVDKNGGTSTINIEIQSLIDAHLLYTGLVTGKLYEWKKSGDTTPVLEEDVPELLAKRLGGKHCCGSQDGNKIFQVAGGL